MFSFNLQLIKTINYTVQVKWQAPNKILYAFLFSLFHNICTTSQTVSFISMINYFSCHFLLMLSYHLLRYSLSLRSSISTIQYQKQQFNTDIPSQDHFIIVKSGTGFFWIFLLGDWDFQCSSCISSIHVATFWRFQILLKLKIWKAKGLASSKIWHLLKRMKYSNPNWNCPEPRPGLGQFWFS